MNNELKPCPFCGNDLLEMKDRKNAALTWYFVWCPKCGAGGPNGISNKDSAVAFWNRARAPVITDSGEMITDKQPTPDWIMLAAVMYQAAGAYNMPARIMDMLAAAKNGEDFGNPLLLLPIEYPEQEDQE